MAQTVTSDMQLFNNVRSLLTAELLSAINDSPTLVAQMLAYEAAVVAITAKAITTGSGGGGYFMPAQGDIAQYIFLGQDNFSGLSNGGISGKIHLSKAIDALAHEIGHYAYQSRDAANWAAAGGSTEDRIQACLTTEGYAVINNYLVKREIEAAARLRGETPPRTVTGDVQGNGLLTLLDAIYAETDGSRSIDDYAAGVGNLYGVTNPPSVGGYDNYLTMCRANANAGGGINPAPMPVLETVPDAWTTSWTEPDGTVIQLRLDWGQIATFVSGLEIGYARFLFDLTKEGNVEGGTGMTYLAGEEGNDTLTCTAGAGLMVGGTGDDKLSGGEQADVLYGDARKEDDTETGGADALDGGNGSDKLYGGGGADILKGQGGADYLEGNGGDDTLVGGAGGDFLVGGAGDDTYVIVTGEGNDTIEDGDGAGAIELDGARLDGGTALAPGVWVRGGTTYHFEAGADGRGELLIRQGAVTVRVERFRDGELGIVLEGEDALAGAAPLTEAADHIGPAQNPAPGLDGLGGNDVLVSHELSAALLGGGGGDLLFGGAGADRLEGGAGGDYLNGGAGADLILGGRRELPGPTAFPGKYQSSAYCNKRDSLEGGRAVSANDSQWRRTA